MINISNGLSFLRAPLALLFLSKSIPLRLLSICLAMFTDSIDGYLARKWRQSTQVGTILDPAMDKFFVYFSLGVFLIEGKVETWQACSMIARDFSLCLFGTYLSLAGKWHSYQFRSIRWGKITTALQFLVLIALTINFEIPRYSYVIFILFALLAFIELFRSRLASMWGKESGRRESP